MILGWKGGSDRLGLSGSLCPYPTQEVVMGGVQLPIFISAENWLTMRAGNSDQICSSLPAAQSVTYALPARQRNSS